MRSLRSRGLALAMLPVLLVPVKALAQYASDLAAARTFMEGALGPQCGSEVYGAESDERFELRYRYGYESMSDPEHVAVLYRLACTAGAYNLIDAYVLRNEYDEMSVAAFAEPELDIAYENDDFEGKVESIAIAGYGASSTVVNSGFDPERQTITSYNKWRGIGDAWSSGTWRFHEGRFILVRYEVDAAYDEKDDGAVVYAAPGH